MQRLAEQKPAVWSFKCQPWASYCLQTTNVWCSTADALNVGAVSGEFSREASLPHALCGFKSMMCYNSEPSIKCTVFWNVRSPQDVVCCDCGCSAAAPIITVSLCVCDEQFPTVHILDISDSVSRGWQTTTFHSLNSSVEESKAGSNLLDSCWNIWSFRALMCVLLEGDLFMYVLPRLLLPWQRQRRNRPVINKKKTAKKLCIYAIGGVIYGILTLRAHHACCSISFCFVPDENCVLKD